jgi:hypothetical protein
MARPNWWCRTPRPIKRLLDLAEEAKVVEGIRRGLEDMKAGRTMSLDDFQQK